MPARAVDNRQVGSYLRARMSKSETASQTSESTASARVDAASSQAAPSASGDVLGDNGAATAPEGSAEATADGSIDGATAEDVAAADEPEDPAAALEAARAEAAANHDKYLRAHADLENIRRRHARELAERSRYEGERLITDLLPVIDDLSRALEAAGDNPAGVAEGVELVHKALVDALARHGVERIEAEGQPFDPTVHEAVAAVETGDAEPGTVIADHRAGYRLCDRLLRPAMVAVAKAPAETNEN